MRIRVDTEDLKAKAQNFQSAADSFGQAGDDILNVALSLPSYDGQLSGPAQAAAYEIQRQSREVQSSLTGDAQSLIKTAKEFEAVDNSVVANINNYTNILGELLHKLGTGIDNGIPGFIEGIVGSAMVGLLIGTNSEQIAYDKLKEKIDEQLDNHQRGGESSIGYDYNPATKTLKIWWKDGVKTYTSLGPSDTWPEGLQDFKDAVNGVDDAKKEILIAEFGNIFAMGYDVGALIIPPALEGAMATSITALGADVGTMYNLVEKELSLRKAILEIENDSSLNAP